MAANIIVIIKVVIAAAVVGVLFARAETIVIYDWVVPYGGPKYVDANVGDTIEFRWDYGEHNVFIHPNNPSCDLPPDAIEVGSTSPSTYTFTEQDEGKLLFFACDVGSHCLNGQNMKVKVAVMDPLKGLSTDTCSKFLPTSTGMAATACNLPPDQVCCYNVQVAIATVCWCNNTLDDGKRTYYCNKDGVPEDCPDDQNPNVITPPPAESVINPTSDGALCSRTTPESGDPCDTDGATFIQCCYSKVDAPPDYARICSCIDTSPKYYCYDGSMTECMQVPEGGEGGPIDPIVPPPPDIVDDRLPPPPPLATTTSPPLTELEEIEVNYNNNKLEDCAGMGCDPSDPTSCDCRPGLECRIRSNNDPNNGGVGGVCSAVPKETSRERLSGDDGMGGAASGRVRSRVSSLQNSF